jgi:hypothetical protein
MSSAGLPSVTTRWTFKALSDLPIQFVQQIGNGIAVARGIATLNHPLGKCL